MANPNVKILIYNTSDVLTHTITEDVLEAAVTPTLTDAIGKFSFMLPGKKTHSYVYNDIGNNYKAKIFLGYGTLGAGDLQLVGKILHIDSTKGEKGGFYRVFSGKDFGEILERRLETNKRYENLGASTIVAVNIATELGIYDAAKIEADTTAETVTIRTESFLNYLKKVSDYWYDGSTKVQKDFYVDVEEGLVWKSRPHRTSGVETLTASGVNANILSYRLTYDITPVKNSITVYGAPTTFLPQNQDDYTENLTNWTATYGTLQLSTTKKLGTYAIGCQGPGGGSPNYDMLFQRSIPRTVIRDINTVRFWHQFLVQPSTAYFRLLAPDTSNYFQADLDWGLGWHFNSFGMGPTQIYDAVSNPNGVWTKVGSPNWWDIQGIQFYRNGADASDDWTLIDAFYFAPDRWVGTGENGTSQNVYGLREAEFTDDNLLSESECQKRAETLALQLGDRTLALEVATVGNTNIKIGDRCPVTLPADNVSAVNFDVVSVTHSFLRKPQALRTRASLIYGADTRAFPPRTPVESVNKSLQNLKAVTSELYSRIVR